MKYISLLMIAFVAASNFAIREAHGEQLSGAGLPSEWNGFWKGACTTTYADGQKLSYTMGLRIAPIEGRNANRWTITYKSSEMNQTRSYEILAVDAENGYFQIDERNSILLDTYLIGDTLHSRFEVEGKNLESTYRVTSSSIEVTMISSSTKPKTKSGGENGTSEVVSFEHLSVQRASLERVN